MLGIVCAHCNGGTGKSGKAWTSGAQLMSSLAMILARPLWAVGLAVITTACYYGYLLMVDGFFSHWAWHPLVKLTYGTYLLHIIIIATLGANMTGYFHYSLSEDVLHAFSHFALTYAASVVMWCLVERPCATLTDAMMPKKQQQTPQARDTCAPKAAAEEQRKQALLTSECQNERDASMQ